MKKHWSNQDLIDAELAQEYYDYKVCKQINSVLVDDTEKGIFVTVILLHREHDNKRIAIYLERVFEAPSIGTGIIAGFVMKAIHTIEFADADEGNRWYKRLIATKRISQKGNVYYNLKAAL